MKRLAVLWGPALGWMAVVFIFSAQPSFPPLVPSPLEELIAIAVHIVEYAVLAALLCRAGVPSPRRPGLLEGLALWATAAFYGLTDG